jgi:exopolysaccharide biosynthesis polyprenyl glycosylphosphotransferase
MTKRHLMTLRLMLMLGDGLSAFLVFMLVSVARFREDDPNAVWSVGMEIPVAATLFALLWVLALWAMGLYRLRARWSLITEGRDIVRADIVLVAVTLSLLFLFHQDDVSRLFLAILFVAQPAVTLASRAGFRSWFDALRRQGRNTSYMLVAGTGALAQEFADAVERHPSLGIRVIGHVSVPKDAGTAEAAASVVTRPVLGSIFELGELFKANVVDEVAVCLPVSAGSYLEGIVAIAADEGKTVRVPVAPEQEVISVAVTEDFEGFVVKSVIHDSQRDVELVIKRVVDLVLGSVAFVVLSPVMLLAAIAIRWRDGSPILFRQTRIGRHGRSFTIYKFRTMVPDAEARYHALAEESDTQGAAFKMLDDPRVTPLGRFLRRSSVDELPQLLNVLRGEMSLVGPRPAPPREVAAYDLWHRRRLSMRPGITGLWQVESRIDEHFDDRAELDLRYIDQWSLWMDVRILARTVPAVFLRQGR